MEASGVEVQRQMMQLENERASFSNRMRDSMREIDVLKKQLDIERQRHTDLERLIMVERRERLATELSGGTSLGEENR